MRHQNTVFHDLTKRIPWAEFDRIVERHRGDRRVRRLTCKGQLLALLFGQLSGADSLRGIATTMGSHSARLYHAGSKVPARSTLADANATRPWQVFGDLFAHMAGNASRATRRHIRDAVRILDATRIGLNGLSAGWAGGVPGTEAAKVHVVYDPVADVPLRADLTSCRVNDITPARALEPEAGATYVFDLGYYSFQWWADLDAAGCRAACPREGGGDQVQAQYEAEQNRDPRHAGRGSHPVRPHRLPARTHGKIAPQSVQ